MPGKNARVLGGLPLVAWSVRCARAAGLFADVIVSTDTENLATIARDAGATVPWLRPPELATDSATSVDVCRHALDWYERNHGDVDAIVLLQPTSPFRRIATLASGLGLFARDPQAGVVSVSPAAAHPAWCRSIDAEGFLMPFCGTQSSETRSQDLPPAWQLNGLLYIAAPTQVRSGTLIGPRPLALPILDEIEAIDIDTEMDWMLAELAVSRGLATPTAQER